MPTLPTRLAEVDRLLWISRDEMDLLRRSVSVILEYSFGKFDRQSPVLTHGRKVRAPQGRVLDNVQSAQVEG
ncbi:hypothetical protein GCM10020370_20970 [Paenibacillus hodogayensis]